MANINLYKVIREHFLLALTDFKIFTFKKLVTLKMEVKVIMFNIRSGAIRQQIPYFLSEGYGNCLHFPALLK